MIKPLKLSITILLTIGIFSSIGALLTKIIYTNTNEDNIVILAPENEPIIKMSKNIGGYKVSNLDIEILNNKKALDKNEKMRPIPVKPELLPIQIEEGNENQKVKKEKLTKKKLSKIETIPKPLIKPKIKKKNGLYRVQFGSFRNLNKAEIAMQSMNNKFQTLLSKVKIEIFTYENANKILFHRVWTKPLSKVSGLELCDKFRSKNIICILQPNK